MTNFRLTYAVFGENWDPLELTEIIKIEPTAYWIKGEIIDKYLPNKVYRKETNWELSLGVYETLFSEDITDKFVELFLSRVDVLARFIEDNNLGSKLFIIPEISNNGTPGIYLDKRLLNLLVKLNAEIDIDLYVIR